MYIFLLKWGITIYLDHGESGRGIRGILEDLLKNFKLILALGCQLDTLKLKTVLLSLSTKKYILFHFLYIKKCK